MSKTVWSPNEAAREDKVLSENLRWTSGRRVWKIVLMTLLLCGTLTRNSEAIIVCDDTQVRTTSTRSGFGWDCATAQSDLESDTRAEALSVCQSLGYDTVCGGSLVVVTKTFAWNEK